MNATIRISAIVRSLGATRQLRQVSTRRGYATQIGTDKAGSQGAKLPFRFGPSNVPIELWPMGFIIGAGVFGGSFALYHHLSSDDLRHHNSGKIEETSHSFNKEDASGTTKPPLSVTNYAGNGTPISGA